MGAGVYQESGLQGRARRTHCCIAQEQEQSRTELKVVVGVGRDSIRIGMAAPRRAPEQSGCKMSLDFCRVRVRHSSKQFVHLQACK